MNKIASRPSTRQAPLGSLSSSPVAMESLHASVGAPAQPSMSLSDILQQSRKLTSQLGRESDLPAIQLGIDQIESQSRKLVSKSVRGGNSSSDARAHYLLASGGIDAAQLSHAIQQTNIANTFEPLQPVYDTDMDGFIRHEHEQVILSMIEEGRRDTLEQFQQTLSRTLHCDWQARKQRILEELGQHCGSGDARVLVGGAPSFRASVPLSADASNVSNASIVQQSRMIRYDSVMSRLNRARLDAESMPLIHAFMETVESFAQEPSRKRALLDAWIALKYMVHEGASVPVQLREYAPIYMNAEAFERTPAGAELREKWIRSARSYLEMQFGEYVEQVIASNPLKAQRGGVPSARATAAAFLRVQLRMADGTWPPALSRPLDTSTGTPLWALVYHLVRMGHIKEAVAAVQDNEEALQTSDASFLPFLKAWAEDAGRQLPRGMREHWMGEYVARFRNASPDDPYRYALYRIMGRFDVTKKFPAPLVMSTENWLWLQLCLIHESSDASHAPALQSYTLRDLANKVEKYGDAHFDPKGHRPLHYFQLLLLVGRFENAIAFLHSRPAYQVDAVHFAVALTYYGMLRIPSAAQAPPFDLATCIDGVSYIDLVKMIRRYVAGFARMSHRDALSYISLLCLNSDCASPVGAEQVHACHDQVVALLRQLPTSAFVELLGDVKSDGVVTQGLIEQQSALLHLEDRAAILTHIVLPAAQACESEQRMTDAILLYNYAHERDTVVAVLNRELGASLMQPANLSEFTEPVQEGSVPLTSSAHIVALARAVLANYEQQGYTSHAMHVCRTLLGLKRAASLFHADQLPSALQVLESLQILPLDAESRKDVVSITRKAEDFKKYDENITINFSDIVLMAMNLLYKLHQALKDSMDRTNSTVLLEYQSQARALMMWAGMLRFRMSNETYCQLTRLDVFVR